MHLNIHRGRSGEDIAADFFLSMGYTILERNYRNRFGEIDLVLEKDDVLVFAEIKTRSSCRFGLPQEAVTVSKQHRIRRIAMSYIQDNGMEEREVRFDVVGIVMAGGKVSIEHITGAF
jgi:putative endonuclease